MQMAVSSRGATGFWTQTGALLRKNLIIEKRNKGKIIWILIQGLLWSSLLLLSQKVYDKVATRMDCVDEDCNPQEIPPLLRIPDQSFAAVRTEVLPFKDLPDESCRLTDSCPVTVLVTGNNQSLGEVLSANMFSSPNSTSILGKIPNGWYDYDLSSLYSVQSQCKANSSFEEKYINVTIEAQCVQGLTLWRNTPSAINDELYKGYFGGNKEHKVNEIVAAYDFQNSNRNNFHVSVWYNKSIYGDSNFQVPRSVNLASNAYLQYLLGPGAEMEFEFVQEMKKSPVTDPVDFSLWASPLFLSAIILQLYPLALKLLVNERKHKLRIMMKMHGLGDGPYWMITYAYFLFVCSIYVIFIVGLCSAAGLRFFTLNDYTIQLVFYFIYLNLQISVSFLASTFFSDLKTVSVMTTLFIAGTALLGKFLFEDLVTNPLVPRSLVIAMELYPGFSLYRGLYEFGQYSAIGKAVGIPGMRWRNLSDSENGMREVLVIMIIEWLIVLYVGYHVDARRNPLSFLQRFLKKPATSNLKPSLKKYGAEVSIDMEKPDVSQEREKVEQLILARNTDHGLISDNLRKVYPGKDGNPDKVAVKGLSISLPRAECFGMLGPNGAGKTSFINMMIGLTKPTSGTAYVEGMDLCYQMDEICTSMGVCPQHDLLWGCLTGREHLLFYGRLKNLKGSDLTQAVEGSLKSVNLFYGGVADKQAKKYSGGMKRRLSVAISLIGDPKVVYMDEPSSGLDPASRSHLWNVIKKAKKNRAIFLTTHSMEEAEALCDRLAIFVGGDLQCIGKSNELKLRYGGSYVFTMTTPSEHDEDVENLVRTLSPRATKIYHISGTQKFELPKDEVKISKVFEAVENAKNMFTVYAWGLADTTLEDVFLKVADKTEDFNPLS